jgi:hypothetical protein
LRAGEELEEGNESDMRGPPGSERERGGRKLGRGDVLGRKKENEPWGFARPKRENGKRKKTGRPAEKREGRWDGLEKEKKRREGKIRGLNFLFLFMILKGSQFQTQLCNQK